MLETMNDANFSGQKLKEMEEFLVRLVTDIFKPGVVAKVETLAKEEKEEIQFLSLSSDDESEDLEDTDNLMAFVLQRK